MVIGCTGIVTRWRCGFQLPQRPLFGLRVPTLSAILPPLAHSVWQILCAIFYHQSCRLLNLCNEPRMKLNVCFIGAASDSVIVRSRSGTGFNRIPTTASLSESSTAQAFSVPWITQRNDFNMFPTFDAGNVFPNYDDSTMENCRCAT